MEIYECAKLPIAVVFSISAPPQIEIPPSARFEVASSSQFDPPPPSSKSHTDFVSKTTSSMLDPCTTRFFPMDLLENLHLSDPQEEECLMDTYSVPVTRRASWLFPVNMSADPTMEVEEKVEMAVDMVKGVIHEEEEDMVVDMFNGSIVEPCILKDVGRKMKRNRKERAEERDGSGRKVWRCKKNDGKKWCRSFCSNHSDSKPPQKFEVMSEEVRVLRKHYGRQVLLLGC